MEKFQLNNKYGFKDDDHNIIVPAIYDAIPYSISDRNIVRKDGKCGVVSQDGEIIIDIIFDGIVELTNGLYAVRVNLDQKNWECYVIDEFGKTIIKNNYRHIYNVGRYIQCFKDACCEFHTFSSEVNRYSYKWQKDGFVYDVNGNFIRQGKAIEDLGAILLFDKESQVIAFDVNENRLLLN
ncbi:MAG: WG repeat-containing protein, partial [Alistipes sp.]|nr:WG repeat-containing protein [Alistipes sp.]